MRNPNILMFAVKSPETKANSMRCESNIKKGGEGVNRRQRLSLNASGSPPIALDAAQRPLLFLNQLLENILDPFFKSFLKRLLRHVCTRLMHGAFVNIRM
jgi:hypothetical protein